MCAVTIRPIHFTDNEPLAAIIRRSLEEFNANKPGTVYLTQPPISSRLFLKLPAVLILLQQKMAGCWEDVVSFPHPACKLAPANW